MSTTLTYFDFDASRGLECRLALHVAGVDFEDDRIARDQWRALKPTTPFGGLPVLSEGDRRVAHSSAILRYVGLAHGLHPTDPWTAARHDALMESVADLRNKVPGGRDKSDEEKRTAREAFAQGWLTHWATTVSDEVAGPFIEGEKMHVADIKLFVILRAYLGGGYDYIPASFFDAYPKLQALFRAVEEHPSVKQYFASR
jgi:prostaglandin-H2 D-isomerase / glutathione transferase